MWTPTSESVKISSKTYTLFLSTQSKNISLSQTKQKQKSVGELRNFNVEWLRDPDVKPWLARKVNSNSTKSIPKCIACDVTFINKKSTLIAHSRTEKHKNAQQELQIKQRQQTALATFIDDQVTQNVKSLELRICLLIAEKPPNMFRRWYFGNF